MNELEISLLFNIKPSKAETLYYAKLNGAFINLFYRVWACLIRN